MGCTQGASKASASTQKPTTLLTGENAKKGAPTTAAEVLGEADATKVATLVDCTFSPGLLGLVADGASGMVKAVSPGQGQELGVRADWQMLFIDGQKFTLALLDAKIRGQDAYTITFAQATRSVACTFQVGNIGLTAISGMVTTVCPGQGQEMGVEVGWQITHIDGQPYTGELLDSKIVGEAPYAITFALGGGSKIDQPTEQNVREQKVESLVVADSLSAQRSPRNRRLEEERRIAEQTPIAEPTVESSGVTRKQKPHFCC